MIPPSGDERNPVRVTADPQRAALLRLLDAANDCLAVLPADSPWRDVVFTVRLGLLADLGVGPLAVV